ncbi:choice-of-anchor Q domain-containing protein, partial [Xanthomonas maliensis]|uniref:choice-of-anchor Q domain-containing protein n=1 Tax=Xanthomonas maliensis TaxID=1321368 RepID=UPI0003B2F879
TLWAYAPDTIDVRYSTFANNIAYGGPAGGARISLGFGDTTHSGTTITTPGIINVEETSFLSNRAEKSNAGALYMDCYGPSCNVSNSTFYGNYAKGVGAAIQHVGWQPSNGDQGKTTVRFNNVTFAENTPGATLFGSGFDIRNSILYSKTERTFCSDQSNSGNNLVEYSAAGGLFHSCLTSGLVRTADPLLGAPANNGGPTLTQLPASTSPARNLGSNCRSIDQRGDPRSTSVCDAGAVQIQ